MHNGIGLQTARGSGTNGYVQRNTAFIKRPKGKIEYKTEPQLAPPERKPNQELLEHELKRQIEIKCMEMEELMISQGFPEDEIEKKVSKFREMLRKEQLSDDGKYIKDVRGKVMSQATHCKIAMNQQKNEALKQALKISKDYVGGTSLSANKLELEEKAREKRKMKEEETRRERDNEKKNRDKRERSLEKEKKTKKRSRHQSSSTSSTSSTSSSTSSDSSTSSSSSSDSSSSNSSDSEDESPKKKGKLQRKHSNSPKEERRSIRKRRDSSYEKTRCRQRFISEERDDKFEKQMGDRVRSKVVRRESKNDKRR